MDTVKAFDTARHSGLLYKLSQLHLPANLIKLICSFLSDRKFGFSVKANCIRPRKYEQVYHKKPFEVL